jgi:hypothetical protein
MYDGLHYAKVVQAPSAQWAKFRETVRHMHILLQLSYSESLNMVTADGIAMGVPSVVSDAIEWAPWFWKAPVDDSREIAKVGVRLLCNPFALLMGRWALARHNRKGLKNWYEIEFALDFRASCRHRTLGQEFLRSGPC